MIETLKRWARTLRRDVIALYLAARDPRTPWYAKAMAGIVAAYALSPIDLIPDFIPILGYVDDLILVPLGMRSSGNGNGRWVTSGITACLFMDLKRSMP